MDQLAELRKQDWWFRVTHSRLPKSVVQPRMSEAKLRSTVSLWADKIGFGEKLNSKTRGTVSSYGGRTRIEAWRPGAVKGSKPETPPDFVAEALCSAQDRFVRRIGYNKAAGRLVAQIKKAKEK